MAFIWGRRSKEKAKKMAELREINRVLLEENAAAHAKYEILGRFVPAKILEIYLEQEMLAVYDESKEDKILIPYLNPFKLAEACPGLQSYPNLLPLLASLQARFQKGEREISEVLEKREDSYMSWGRFRAGVVQDKSGSPFLAICTIVDMAGSFKKYQGPEEPLIGIRQENRKQSDPDQIDSLTGLYNKESSMELVDTMLKEYKGGRYAFFVVDLDYFKQVNDTHGHLAGDKLLTGVGRLLASHFRSTDLVGRIGGDEFAVLMTDVLDWEMAKEKGEGILRLVTSFAEYEVFLSATASVGIAFGQENTSFRELYKKAERALYEAKKEGGNSCKFYRE